MYTRGFSGPILLFRRPLCVTHTRHSCPTFLEFSKGRPLRNATQIAFADNTYIYIYTYVYCRYIFVQHPWRYFSSTIYCYVLMYDNVLQDKISTAQQKLIRICIPTCVFSNKIRKPYKNMYAIANSLPGSKFTNMFICSTHF